MSRSDRALRSAEIYLGVGPRQRYRPDLGGHLSPLRHSQPGLDDSALPAPQCLLGVLLPEPASVGDPGVQGAHGLAHPYVHIALNRTLGARRLLQHSGGKGRAQCLALLSAREIEIARWVARGKTNWEIGQILHISDKTVKTHMQNIFSKLQATSRAQIAALFADA
ncbi:helix-turn-helix domain-containing protein [Pseudomonas sp. OHS18]|uniref:helix-turn-helix domain-containing protein n=1 Tax=Pseudomonas sp. OHS18 TaxID=3399679 RepID=UPI003A85AC88